MYKKTAVVLTLFVSLILAAGCKKNPVILSANLPAPLAMPAYPLNVVIDDCDDNDNVNAWGGFWFTYDDTKTPNFGVSEVYPRNGALFTMAPVGPDWDTVQNGPNSYAANMYGIVKEWVKPYVAFIGEGIQMSPTEDPQNFTNFTGIRFWAKVGPGDQIGDYRISFKTPVYVNPSPSDYDYFGIIFTPTTTWTLYDLPFSSLSLSFGTPPPAYVDQAAYLLDSMSGVMGIQIQTKNAISGTPVKGVNYNVDLWIDNIVLYRD